jgi:molybdenum cofactor biosynthesis enzyme MoaA
MESRPLAPEKYYRLPWNLADNAITWLEPTTQCNLYCEGCYRENNPNGHKPIEKVKQDLETIQRLRKTDGISIAGGEPLIYPHIVELVRYISGKGWKPIINTNGRALTGEMVTALADAGLVGFTFHVDSHQKRPGWTGKTEADLNELRASLAEMTRRAGKGRIACAFNATIYRDTLGEIPMLTHWAQHHMDLVQTMVFILYRSIIWDESDLDVYVNGEQIDRETLTRKLVYQYDFSENVPRNILAQEIADQIRTAYPDYEPCAFLNGTEDSRAMKWLLSLRTGNKNRILGHMDSRFMEIVQTVHHLIFGTYMAYTRPAFMKLLPGIFPLALINRSARQILWKWLKNPSNWFHPLHLQAIMIIQPVDVLEDGRQSMCDGCPDIIPYGDRLVWSCRVDELDKLGNFLTAVPKTKEGRRCVTPPSENACPNQRRPC